MSTILPSVVISPSSKTNVTLNGLAGINITVNGITKPDVSKGILIPSTGSLFTITWSCYQTQHEHDQPLIKNINSSDAKAAFNIIPSESITASSVKVKLDKSPTKIKTVKGVVKVTI